MKAVIRLFQGIFFNSSSASLAGILMYLLLTGGCANIVTPSGGEKDIAPPKITSLEPENQSLKFNSKSFTISFDEYIQLSDISTQLIVSPPLKTPPEFVIKGKNLLVKFKDELQPNTTYTLNFGTAIRDINENNPLENFTYVFSTGSFIDSLSLRGTVRNAFTLDNEAGVLVLLYEENTDSIPYLKPPYYYAKANSSGSFALDNLKSGSFKVVALKDENSSFLYDDFDKEMIGFSDTLVSPYFIEKPKGAKKDSIIQQKMDTVPDVKKDSVVSGKSVDKNDSRSLSLLVFQEEKNRQYLKKGFNEYYGKLVFIFNRKPQQFSIEPLNTSFKKEWNITESSVTGDTVIVWLSDVAMDSLTLQVSDNGVVLDTLFLGLKKRSDKIETQGAGSKRTTRESKKFELSLESKPAGQHHFARDFMITFNHPVKDIVAEKMLLKEEQDTVTITLDSKDAAMRKFIIRYAWKPDKKYELYIPPGTFTDIFDLKNDSIRISFSTQPKEFFGNLEFTLKGQTGNYILQLTDEKGKIVMENITTGNGLFTFKDLEPKSYGMRLVQDDNNNGKWDTGNYLQKKQAEKIIPYPQKISVRSNWDVEVEWEVK